MNIETVDELIQSLESAGELSIKERKYLELAKAYQQLAAENVGLKAAFNKPDAWLSWHSIPLTYQEPDRGGEYLAVHEQPGEKNDDGSDSWAVYSKPGLETPATDRIVAGIKADAAAPLVSALKVIANSEQHNGDTVVCDFDTLISVAACALRDYYAQQLREGADK